MHDPYPLQESYFITQHLAHLADLPVQALHQNDTETMLSRLPNPAGKGFSAVDPYAFRHTLHEKAVDIPVNPYRILFLMLVAGPEYLVYDIAIVRQKYQPLRVLIQPAYREDPFRVVDITDDVTSNVCIGSGSDARGLVESQHHHFLLCSRFHDTSINHYLIPGSIPVPGHCYLIVQQYPARLDQAVCFPSGTIAGLTDIFI
jgi:hypothetical protein